MLCREGTHCEDISGKPQCVENQSETRFFKDKISVLIPSNLDCTLSIITLLHFSRKCLMSSVNIPTATCATSPGICPPNTHCEHRDGRLQCIKDKGLSQLPLEILVLIGVLFSGVIIDSPFPCANVDCPEDKYCEFYQGVAQCVKKPGTGIVLQ